MKNKIIKSGVLLIAIVISIAIIVIFEIKNIPVGSSLGGLSAGFLLQPMFSSFADLADNENWKSSQRRLQRAGVLQKETLIRISFAYLFRIKVDGKYFLVQNSRTKKYQPVGGAYKFKEEEAYYLRDNISVENDDRIPVDQITERDYRLLVENKNLRKFVKRFDKTHYRENISDLSREFIEEIFTTGILDRTSFGSLTYRYCGRHMTNVEYGNVFSHYELLLADIVEIQLSNEQEQLFRNLATKTCSKYRFATLAEIQSLGVKTGTNNLADDIANHTPKILSTNTDNLMLKKKHKNSITVTI